MLLLAALVCLFSLLCSILMYPTNNGHRIASSLGCYEQHCYEHYYINIYVLKKISSLTFILTLTWPSTRRFLFGIIKL